MNDENVMLCIADLKKRLYPKPTNRPIKIFGSTEIPSYKMNLSSKEAVYVNINKPYTLPLLSQETSAEIADCEIPLVISEVEEIEAPRTVKKVTFDLDDEDSRRVGKMLTPIVTALSLQELERIHASAPIKNIQEIRDKLISFESSLLEMTQTKDRELKNVEQAWLSLKKKMNKKKYLSDLRNSSLPYYKYKKLYDEAHTSPVKKTDKRISPIEMRVYEKGLQANLYPQTELPPKERTKTSTHQKDVKKQKQELYKVIMKEALNMLYDTPSYTKGLCGLEFPKQPNNTLSMNNQIVPFGNGMQYVFEEMMRENIVQELVRHCAPHPVNPHSQYYNWPMPSTSHWDPFEYDIKCNIKKEPENNGY